MSELTDVYLGISKALHCQPGKASPHLAWRLHPKDFEAMVEELRQQSQYRDMVYLPGGALYVAGVRVFKDYDAPLLEFAPSDEAKHG